jgi:hypothetical protein
MSAEVIAKNAIRSILKDLSDRRGLKHQWEQIDQDIKEEIVAKWEQIVIKAVKEAA